MTSKYTNKNGVKLLTAFAVMAVMLAGAFSIISDASDASEEQTAAKKIAGESFSTAVTEGKMNGDYILTSTVLLETDLTLDLNGHSLTGESGIDIFVVNKNGVNITITDSSKDSKGSITSIGNGSSVIYVNKYNDGNNDYEPGNLSIDGGTYNGGYTIIWKGSTTVDNEVEIKNATIAAKTAGIWLSYQTIGKATINNVIVNSDSVGIYAGTIKKTVIEDTSVTGKTCIEIKCGSVDIKGNTTLTGATYTAGKNIENSGSGGAIATVFINNGYNSYNKDKGAEVPMVINIDKSVVITTKSGDVKIAIGTADTHAKITLNAPSIKNNQIAIERYNDTGSGASASALKTLLFYFNSVDSAAIQNITELSTVTSPANVTLIRDITITGTFNKGSLNINLGSNTLTLGSEAVVTTKVSGAPNADNSENSAVFASYKVGTTGLKISSGSIVLGDGSIPSVGADGTITITGVAKVVGDTVVGAIVLKDGATITIPEGTSLKAGTITQDADANTSVVVNGKLDATVAAPTESSNTAPVIKVSSGAEVSGTVDTKSITYNAGSGEFEFGDTLNSDYTVTKNEYLSSTLTIPEGVTLTIANGGVLNLNGSDIKVFGNLVIESGATISAAKGTESIQIMKGSNITNDGMIGIGSQEVTIAAGDIDGKIKGVGSVSITDISGVSFDLVNTGKTNGNNEAVYILTVSGDIISEGEYSAITITDARIVGDLTIGEKVTAETETGSGTIVSGNSYPNNVSMMSGSTVTVDGKLITNGKLVMKNKSTLVMNGILTGDIVAETADYLATGSYNTGSTTFTLTNDDAKKAYVTSFELSVGTYTFSKKDGSNYVDYIAQRLYIDGSFDWKVVGEEQDSYSGKIAITTATNDVNGKPLNTIISADSEIVLDKGMSIENTITSKLQVDGKVTIPTDAEVEDGAYIGTKYSITITNPTKVITTYIEPFSKVISIIDTVDKKTINVYEDVTVDTEIAINEGQIVNNKGTMTISESGKVTVNAKGAIKSNDVKTVQGTLVIMKGASCNAPVEYASKISNVDYTKYTGIASAMDGLQAGDVVDINGTGIIKTKDLTVPAGVTVNISKNAEITGNLTVPTDAKVIVKDGAELTVSGEKSKVVVNGTLDATDGTLTISKEKASIQSEGTTVLKTDNLTTLTDAKKVNAFVYTNEDNNKVLTNLADATKNAAAQDINNKSVDAFGTIAASTVDLATNLNVTAGSKVVVDTINLASKKSVTIADGAEFTGKITAQTGTDVKSIVSLDKACNITVASESVTENGENIKIMTIAGTTPKGSVTVSEGTVRTSGNMTFTGDGNVLTIADGAELVSKVGTIKSTGSDDKAGITVDGIYTVLNGTTLDIDGIMIVNGTLAIGDENDDVTVNGTLLVYGTVDISTTEDKAGKLNVAEEVIVGSNTLGANGTISGAVEIANSNSAFIKVYAGADMTAAQVNFVSGETTANATVFYINNTEYMTVYTKGAVTLGTIAETFKVSGLNLSNIAWYEADSTTAIGNGDSINGIDALYATAKAATVTGTISAGVGLQIYIDGISVENYYRTAGEAGYYIPVGQHKVTIEVLSGYDGSKAVITFNGATVSNGGTITVSENDFVLTANGATPAVTPTPEPTPIQPSEKDDSMGITEYLLIVLVILAAILVVVVAIRMMRS